MRKIYITPILVLFTILCFANEESEYLDKLQDLAKTTNDFNHRLALNIALSDDRINNSDQAFSHIRNILKEKDNLPLHLQDILISRQAWLVRDYQRANLLLNNISLEELQDPLVKAVYLVVKADLSDKKDKYYLEALANSKMANSKIMESYIYKIYSITNKHERALCEKALAIINPHELHHYFWIGIVFFVLGVIGLSLFITKLGSELKLKNLLVKKLNIELELRKQNDKEDVVQNYSGTSSEKAKFKAFITNCLEMIQNDKRSASDKLERQKNSLKNYFKIYFQNQIEIKTLIFDLNTTLESTIVKNKANNGITHKTSFLSRIGRIGTDKEMLISILNNSIYHIENLVTEGQIETVFKLNKKGSHSSSLSITLNVEGHLNPRMLDAIFPKEKMNINNLEPKTMSFWTVNREVERLGGTLEHSIINNNLYQIVIEIPVHIDNRNETKPKPKQVIHPSSADNLGQNANETREKNEKSPDFEGGKIRAKKILIVEDNKINQLVVSKMLNGEGYETVSANNGQEALDYFKDQDFDLILMDIQMPIVDGFKATHFIRNYPDENKSKTPIVALTASSFLSKKEKAMMFGMDEHISKPFEKEELIGVVDHCLNPDKGGLLSA